MVKQKYVCAIRGHDEVYTDEYRGSSGNVQGDKVCRRCGRNEVAWVGPSVERIEDVCGIEVPTKEEVYNRLES